METINEKVGGMETEAIKRKERLKALKRKAESGPQNSETTTEIPKYNLNNLLFTEGKN